MVEEPVEAEAAEERENRPLVAIAAKVAILDEGAKIETENIFLTTHFLYFCCTFTFLPDTITYLTTITKAVNKLLALKNVRRGVVPVLFDH